MRKGKKNIKQLYNKILSRLELSLRDQLNLSFIEEYDLILEQIEKVIRRLLVSNRISNLVMTNIERLYLIGKDCTISEAIHHLTYDSIDEPDPSRYNVRFYQRLISQFDERITTSEYSSLGEVLHQILIDEDVLDEISYIIYFMPQWFRDMMKCKIKADDLRDDELNPDATVETSSTEDFNLY